MANGGLNRLICCISYYALAKSKVRKKSDGDQWEMKNLVLVFIRCHSMVRLHLSDITIRFGIRFLNLFGQWIEKNHYSVCYIIHNKQSDFGCEWIFFKSSRTQTYYYYFWICNIAWMIHPNPTLPSTPAECWRHEFTFLFYNWTLENEVFSTSVWIGSTKQHFVRFAI